MHKQFLKNVKYEYFDIMYTFKYVSRKISTAIRPSSSHIAIQCNIDVVQQSVSTTEFRELKSKNIKKYSFSNASILGFFNLPVWSSKCS
jgi:hypothetical protein